MLFELSKDQVVSAGEEIDLAVSVDHVSKMYPLYARPSDRLKQALWYTLPAFIRTPSRQFYREFWALHDISFEIKRGEILGIIGRNGSGKSTLLQIIAGTLTPTSGEVQINGRVAALLELGSGFNPEFSGRENVYLNGTILGISRQKMEERFDEITAFADIGEFIDQPVKHYSSGMFVRLAFAVQVCSEPDILIVDEALSVGDIFFQQKCHARMEELKANRTAIILVSHSMTAIEKYCTQTIVLDHGKCVFRGRPNEAVERYYHIEQSTKPARLGLNSPSKAAIPANLSFEAETVSDWPPPEAFLDLSQAVVIGQEDIAWCTGVALCNSKGEPCATFEIGDTAYIYFEYELLQDIEVPIGGVVITNKYNINIHGKNSLQHRIKAPDLALKGARLRFRQTIELAIAPGEYTFQVGLAMLHADIYARASEIDHLQLNSYIQTILRVRQVGKFLVQRKNQGLNLPFYGYTDLKGESILSVVYQHAE